jgi:hypothetical protein
MVKNKMVAKTIQKPDTKSVRKMVFGGSLYTADFGAEFCSSGTIFEII